MAGINDIATTTVRVNGEEARNELKRLQKEANMFRDMMTKAYEAGDVKGFKKAEDALRKTNAEIRKMQRNSLEIDNVLKNLSTAGPKELQRTIRAINQQLNSGNVKRETEEWDTYQKKLKLVSAELQKIKNEGKESSSWMSRLGDGFNRYAALATSAIAALTGLTITVRKSVNDYAQMEEAQSQVIKYTELTKEEVKDLNEEFKKMDTRTARNRLNELAGDAGRLGIQSKEKVLEFVDAADKINVALGEDLGKDAVKNIGKLAVMFGEDKTKGLRGAMLATGSAINEVAQNSSAAEAYLVDFTARVAGAANQANISQANIIGFASALDQNMQQVEMAGTAFQGLLLKMYQKPAMFAKMAGEDVKSFTKLLKQDANEAVLQFLSSLSKRGGLDQLAPMFEDMKLDGARASGVLSTLAGKIDQIREAQKLATDAYNDGTSAINEFNVQNNTIQAQLDKAKKKFNDISIELGERLYPVMRDGIHIGSMGLKLVIELLKFYDKYKTEINALTIAIGLYVIQIKLAALATKNAIIIQKTYAVTTALLTGNIKKATTSIKSLWKVIKLNPLGFLLSSVALLGGALYALTQRSKEMYDVERINKRITIDSANSYDEQKQKIDHLNEKIHNNNLSINERRKAINELKRIIPEYQAEISKEGKIYNENTIALSKYNNELKNNIIQKTVSSELEQLYRRREIWQKAYDEASDSRRKERIKKILGYTDTAISSLKKRFWDLNKTQTTFEIPTPPDWNKKKIGETKNENNTPYFSDTDKEKAEKARKEALKKALDNIDADKGIQQAKIKADYAMLKISKEEYDGLMLGQDKIALEKKMKLYNSKSKEYNELLGQHFDIELKEQQRCISQSIEDIEKGERWKKGILSAQYAEKLIDKNAYEEGMYNVERDALIKKQMNYLKDSEEYSGLKRQIEQLDADREIKRAEQLQEKLKDIREKYQKMNIDELMNKELSGLDLLYNSGLIKEEEYQRMKRAIKRKYLNENIDQIYETGGSPEGGDNEKPMSAADKRRAEIALLKEAEKDGLISHQEFLQRKTEANAIYLEELKKQVQGVYSIMEGILSAYSSYSSACQQLEIAEIEEKYDKEIEAAGNNSEKVKELEKKKQQETAAIKTKFNEQAMQMEIAQALASTALGAINAYTSASKVPVIGYILAPIAAAAAVAAGMMQVATIKTQHEAQAKGYYDGGFTPNGKWDEETGTVHAGEFVANRFAVRNKQLRPVFNLIDQAQKNNTIGRLSAEDVSRSLGYSGMVITSQQMNSSYSPMNVELVRIGETIDRLTKVLDNEICAYTTIDGERGFEKTYNRYKQLTNNAKR